MVDDPGNHSVLPSAGHLHLKLRCQIDRSRVDLHPGGSARRDPLPRDEFFVDDCLAGSNDAVRRNHFALHNIDHGSCRQSGILRFRLDQFFQVFVQLASRVSLTVSAHCHGGQEQPCRGELEHQQRCNRSDGNQRVFLRSFPANGCEAVCETAAVYGHKRTRQKNLHNDSPDLTGRQPVNEQQGHDQTKGQRQAALQFFQDLLLPVVSHRFQYPLFQAVFNFVSKLLDLSLSFLHDARSTSVRAPSGASPIQRYSTISAASSSMHCRLRYVVYY